MSLTRACSLADVSASQPLAVTVDGESLVLVRCGDEVFALLDECSHAAIALSEGDVEDCTLECWLHGSRFDARTGRALNLPATEPVPTYPVQIDGDEVLVDVEHPVEHQES